MTEHLKDGLSIYLVYRLDITISLFSNIGNHIDSITNDTS